MISDPRFAPKRADLPWLRRRHLPATAATPSQLVDFVAGRTHGEHPHASPSKQVTQPAPSPPAPSPSPPSVSSSLDLDAPTPAAAPPTPSPPAPTPSPPSGSSSLDLDAPAPAAAPPASREPAASAPPRRKRVDRRVAAGERIILTPADPTVTLTRLQSGIGTLTIDAAASDEVGDLRLGCAYELADEFEMTVQMTQGDRFAPPHSKRPVLVGSRERFERISVDLRQVHGLRRFVVYAFSAAKQPLTWGGTLVITTFGGGRIELPLDTLSAGDVAVLLSVYRVRGELVLRAEMQTLYGDVREAARAYGYDRVTWLDGRTPVE